MAKRVENTKATADSNPTRFLTEALILGSSDAIERQEAEGQRQLCESSQIPTKLSHGLTEDHLRSMGFVLGEPIPGDTIFRDATFPANWSFKATDHSMWSDIVDDKGRKRLAIFYKAAFYDRSARMSVEKRYHIGEYDGPDGPSGNYGVSVTDCETQIKCWPLRDRMDFDGRDRDRAEAVEWLAEHFPDWEDPLKYWE